MCVAPRSFDTRGDREDRVSTQYENMKIWSPISSQFKFQRLTPSSRGERSIWSCIVKSLNSRSVLQVLKKNLQIWDLFSLRGPGAIWANLQSKISPRLLNIFSSGFFSSKTMTLLHEIRTFPALSDGIWKWRHYTYHIHPKSASNSYPTRIGGTWVTHASPS